MSSETYNGKKIELQLYQHDESPSAFLLSKDGCRRNAEWIPRSLLTVPAALALLKIDGEPCHRGIFSIAEFKAKEVGWLVEDDPRQLRLV